MQPIKNHHRPGISILIVDTMDWGKPYEKHHPLTAKGAWFHRSLGQSTNIRCQYVHWAQKKDRWKSEHFDVCVLSGSIRSVKKRDHATREMEKWVSWCIDNERKLMGVCYGHQLIASLFGGKIGNLSSGPRVGNVNLKLSNSALGKNSIPGLKAFTETNWLTSHLEYVEELPGGFEVLADSEHCPAEAYIWEDKLMGLQFHPEMDLEILHFLWRPHLEKPWTSKGAIPVRNQLERSEEPKIKFSFGELLYEWANGNKEPK